jgi:hypothetical protein
MAARRCVTQTAAAHPGGSRFFVCAALAALLALAMPGAAAAPAENGDLARVHALIKGGATQLAEKLIDQYQLAPAGPADWIRWEQERFALLRARRDWAALAARVISLPDGLPADFVRSARTEAARAELEGGHAEGARRFLRALLWSQDGSRDEQADWRQLVIRSYLVEDNVADAYTALERYRADFQVNNAAWRLLEASVLIRAGEAKKAYALAAGIQTHEGRQISLLAALRSNALAPPAVLQRATALAEETRNKPLLQQRAWALAAEAAARANDSLGRISALERALTGNRAGLSADGLFVVSADDLWPAYERYAETAGNNARLLVGNDGAWLKKARSYKRNEAAQARAFYAFLLTHAADDKTKDEAVHKLAASLIEDGRADVLRALFTAGSRYASPGSAPEYARFRLAELALADYDIALAARLMRDLDNPPAGEDVDRWTLRRARVLVYAGAYREAVALLERLLAGKPKVADDFAERYLQVLFDLQAADRHVEAIVLLEALMQQVENPRTRREILYWLAESRSAQGEFRQAAELYLRSATYQHPTGGDMWGQTARYHAAEALGKAGLGQDARAVYQNLLRFTEDAKQRAVIERNIQQLWLTEKKPTTP